MSKKRSAVRKPLTGAAKAKARQTSKIAQIRKALIAAGHRTAAQQAFALGVGRSTAWALLNHDKRTGPSSVVLKRVLSSPNLPPAVRRKVEQYINEKIAGRYGHTKRWLLLFRNQFRTPDNEAEGGLQPFVTAENSLSDNRCGDAP